MTSCLPVILVISLLIGTFETFDLEISPNVVKVYEEEGGSLTFDCSLVNQEEDEEVKLTWFKDDAPLPAPEGLNGDDSLDLHLDSVTTSDSGSYSCRAGGQSKSISLTVYAVPKLKRGLEGQHLLLNLSGSITCDVESSLTPTITWDFEGRRLPRGGGYTRKDNHLLIANVTRANEGTYGCVVRFAEIAKKWTFPISVEVRDPPHIYSWRGTVKAMEGTSSSIICAAAGAPKPVFSFYKDNNTSPLESSPELTIDRHEGKLYWQSVTLRDAGNYTCTATNAVGADSKVNRLIVKAIPRIMEFSDETVKGNDTLRLKCTAVGSPTPKVSIFRLTPGGNTTLKESAANAEDDWSTFQATLEYTREACDVMTDGGSYGCTSSNDLGEVTNVTSVEFTFAPFTKESAAREEYILPNDRNNITCRVFSNPRANFAWFKDDMRIRSSDDDDDDDGPFQVYDEFDGKTSTSTLQITPTSDQSGAYVCNAANGYGHLDVTFSVREAVAPSAPESVRVVEEYSTYVVLAVRDAWNGGNQISKYKIILESSESANLTEVMIEKDVHLTEDDSPIKASDSILRVENLHPKTQYNFSVSAVNLVGLSSPKVVGAKTKAMTVPQQVVIVADKLPCHQQRDVIIRWEQPDSSGSPLEKYRVQYREVAATGAKQWVTKETTSLKYHLEGLQESSKYDLRVSAKNAIGWSKDSELKQFRICKGVAVVQANNTGWLLGIVFAVLVVVCILADLACYAANGCGVTKLICTKIRGGGGGGKSYGDKAEADEKEALNVDGKQVVNTQPTEV